MTSSLLSSATLTRFAWLSIAAAVATIALKGAAYWLTGSVGLLSDALESLVNLAGASMALAMLIVAARPPDAEHPFGHSKAEYFASVVEGALILVAAAGIAWSALPRFITPRPLEQVGLGVAVSFLAALVNLGVALVPLRAGRRYRSITLEADAQHLLTDVWTSAGVLTSVALVAITGWERLDPLVALLVAANITWTGLGIVRSSVRGLMDTILPAEDQAKIQSILDRYRQQGIEFHALRTRRAGTRRFLSMHMLVPDSWTVQQAHGLSERVEGELRSALPGVTINAHIEPLNDPASLQDMQLDRSPEPQPLAQGADGENDPRAPQDSSGSTTGD